MTKRDKVQYVGHTLVFLFFLLLQEAPVVQGGLGCPAKQQSNNYGVCNYMESNDRWSYYKLCMYIRTMNDVHAHTMFCTSYTVYYTYYAYHASTHIFSRWSDTSWISICTIFTRWASKSLQGVEHAYYSQHIAHGSS